MNDKEEADIEITQDQDYDKDEEEKIMFQKPHKPHKSTGQPSHNTKGSKKKSKNKKYKIKYSKREIDLLYEESGRNRNHVYWRSDIASCISNASFQMQSNGHFRSYGMYDIYIIYIQL